ncbi:MAG: hypothetical protein JETCAE03_29990 [Ignavibacteriaceae bacterium]|jgi:hypothetical protein|nr:hypothetical protein [Ignavibacteriaceae bacterium]GIK60872.1 MAG: hypothetical protein BroJett017_17620 [Ignavibacteriota bacterium]GJQ43501.1 MAG: hypothetical protein JETCAE03_29990 [Ignavibacteriaceae bacterium]
MIGTTGGLSGSVCPNKLSVVRMSPAKNFFTFLDEKYKWLDYKQGKIRYN